jgi:hypothetical protein
MSNPTRFLSGIATVPASQVLGSYPLPDPFHTGGSSGKEVFTYQNDFTDLGNAGSRTVTGSSSTFALADGLGGIGVLTPGGTTTASSVYRTAAAFQLSAGDKFWFSQRVKLSAVGTGITGYFGMIKTGAAATDSFLFKIAATGVVSLVSTVDSTATTLVANVTTASSNTFFEVGCHFDGTDLLVYAGHDLVARVTGLELGVTIPDAAMTNIMQITPAATETMSVDFVLSAQEITR